MQFKKLILIGLLCASGIALADGTAYVCPDVYDLRYPADGGQIKAFTTLNGITVEWYGMHNLSNDTSPATAFTHVVLGGQGANNPYKIQCVYDDQDTSKTNATIWMYAHNYGASGVIQPNWDVDQMMCVSPNPADCMFSIVPDK